MGQKITEFPQVDYWVKLTREADKAGATLPHRDSADRKELSQYAEMERARSRSAFSVVLPASMMRDHIDPDETTKAEAEAEEVANDDAPGEDDEAEEEGEGEDDGDTKGA